ncbi:AraC family transcriptional regulator [Hyphomicrobium sulfonivorans]|nr:helix-turn-helix domain-containing protein [Hyphomicrobium sulfonivorans]
MKYRSAEPDGAFLAQSAFIKTRNVRLVALTSSAFHVEASGSPSGLLMVATHGFTDTRHGGRTFEWGKGKGALYLPPGGCSAQSTARSVVAVDIDPANFNRVTEAMLGGRALRTGFSLRQPCFVDTPGSRFDFGDVLKGMVATMDMLGGDAHLIERAALDDALLRVVALLLNFEELSAAEPETSTPRAVVRLACEYIDANLTSTITLTELESITGLSRRSLQYAFRAAFDCTPMQWAAQRRLEAVRSHILAARPGANLTAIAGAYFVNLGEFARMYRQHYGELPSITLKDAIAKRLRS